MILLVQSVYNLFVLAISVTSFALVVQFVKETEGLKLPSAP